MSHWFSEGPAWLPACSFCGITMDEALAAGHLSYPADAPPRPACSVVLVMPEAGLVDQVCVWLECGP